MLIGWDKDNDGEYPPYDGNDLAVLDGNANVDSNNLPMAIWSSGKISNLEIAHLSIVDYGIDGDGTYGAMELFNRGDGNQHHVYVHDVEMSRILKGARDYSATIVFSFWGGPLKHIALINSQVDEYGGFFCRGETSGNDFRFQNLTLKMFGKAGGVAAGDFTVGWKLWGTHNNVEIIDNILDTNPRAWEANNYQYWMTIAQCSQDWTVRNNEFIDFTGGITLQGYSGSPGADCESRPVDNILVDRNIFTQTYDGWLSNPNPIQIARGARDANATAASLTVTNNFMWANADDPNVGWYVGISSYASNPVETQPGTITIVGNTIWGLLDQNSFGGPCYGIKIAPTDTYKQENFVIKNNIINKMHPSASNYNIEVTYAPSNWVANGNVYDANGDWIWNGTTYTTLASWQSNSGQDANSVTGYPSFVDDANGDLHLDPNDTVAQGGGVDISGETDHDYDGDTRDANTKTAGADVP